MPVGITFIGKAGEDTRLLAFAYAFEQATNRRVRPASSRCPHSTVILVSDTNAS